MTTAYKAPEVPAGSVTPELVRDELLACFGSANREFARILDQPVGDEELKRQVREFVASAFGRCGVSFENPTKAGIVAAVEECKRNAEAMMGPRGAEVIREHYAEMAKPLEKLPG
ncbi:MAG: hypothetical protein JRN46_01605 [Nitrososphaerota archaeon]|nr:hypothetical protein [Nitrososphaerota archaeon]